MEVRNLLMSFLCGVLRQWPDSDRGLSLHLQRSVGIASGPPLLTYCLCGGLAAHIYTPGCISLARILNG